MRARSFLPVLACVILLVLSGCGSSKPSPPAGPTVSSQVSTQITSVPAFAFLKSHHLYDVGDVNVASAQLHFITVDGTQPRYLDRARKALETLLLVPAGTTYQASFSDPALASANPLTIKVVPRSQVTRYALLTDDAKTVEKLDRSFGASDMSSHTGGTYSKLPDFVLTTLYTKAKPEGQFKDYFSKTILTEMCQSTFKVSPTADAVDRGFKNANASGSKYPRDHVESTLSGITQELYCNSFGLMAYYAQHGFSYQDYTDYAGQSGLSAFGDPSFVVFDEAMYRSVA